MDIKDALLAEHSKAQSERIADWVGGDAQRFGELAALFLHGEYRVVQRAAPVIGLVAERHPEIVLPILPQLIARMESPEVHVAVRRHVMRLLEGLLLPEELHGPVMHIAFGMLEDVKEAIAVRAHAMSVLGGLARIYPDIRGELELLIGDMLAHEDASAGLRARARLVLNSLKGRAAG